jgi:hypothetical protein
VAGLLSLIGNASLPKCLILAEQPKKRDVSALCSRPKADDEESVGDHPCEKDGSNLQIARSVPALQPTTVVSAVFGAALNSADPATWIERHEHPLRPGAPLPRRRLHQ